jgi:hypothetical protein
VEKEKRARTKRVSLTGGFRTSTRDSGIRFKVVGRVVVFVGVLCVSSGASICNSLITKRRDRALSYRGFHWSQSEGGRRIA